MSLEEHHTGWPKLDVDFLHVLGGCRALRFLIGAPQYSFRDIEGRAVLVNIHQLGSEVRIGRGCRDVQDERYRPGRLHILVQGWGCLHQHILPGLNVVLTGYACVSADHGSATRWLRM